MKQPRLSGVVEAVKADLGQQVKKGQVLAVIASTDLSERRSSLATAQKRLALAQTIYQREKQLWEEGISAKQDYLEAEQTLREAELAVANAREQLQALGSDAGTPGALSRFEVLSETAEVPVAVRAEGIIKPAPLGGLSFVRRPVIRSPRLP
jgi:cobalt-zinc-cadmium efflux system membrane fusion protein